MKYLRVREEKISQWLTSKCLLIHTAATCLHGMVARPSGRSGLVLAFAHDGVERICVVWRCSVNIQWGAVGGGGDPKGQTHLRCRLTQTAACLFGPVRLLRECGA